MKRSSFIMFILLLVMSLICVLLFIFNYDNQNGIVIIDLSEDEILVNNSRISKLKNKSVYLSNDIIYYENNKGFLYGKGTEKDEHSKDEADEHNVVNITKPGTYILQGVLNKGQIAIDLGDKSEKNPLSVVNIILNGVEITSSVAPAIIFYNVYECNISSIENPIIDVDTKNAGANIIIADGSINNIYGSYVARIYKPESVVLNDEKTEVIENKKLHKYDAALYSKMSMNINGGEKGTGILNVVGENEGIGSEMHLTINGGNINIESGNDGINTNEDGISVITINGGNLDIFVNGKTGVGDGIDSNGYLVINNGTIRSQGQSFTDDVGIDGANGMFLREGNIYASGHYSDRLSESLPISILFNFETYMEPGIYTLKGIDNDISIDINIDNSFESILIANSLLKVGRYNLYMGEKQLKGQNLVPKVNNLYDETVFEIENGSNCFYYVDFAT